jgi:small subunit ribosomal protein S17
MTGQRKALIGTVVSDKMDKTVVVVVHTTTRHRIYDKIMKRTRRFMAHDDRFEAKPGDIVRITETRPLSRHKRWRVAEVIQRGEVAEIAPREIDTEYLSLTRERAEPVAPAAATAEATEAAAEPGEAAATEEPASPVVEAAVTLPVGAEEAEAEDEAEP